MHDNSAKPEIIVHCSLDELPKDCLSLKPIDDMALLNFIFLFPLHPPTPAQTCKYQVLLDVLQTQMWDKNTFFWWKIVNMSCF